MELFIPSSVASMVIAGLLLLVIVTKLYIDTKEIRRSRRIYRKLVLLGKKRNNKSFTVVVELNRTANSILPLLDHLIDQNYKKLEVVIVVKGSAGKNAKKILESYSKLKNTKLIIVKYTKNLTYQQIVKRYTKNSIITLLEKDDRLSKEYFVNASVDFADLKSGIVKPIDHIALSSTMASAIKAHFAIWHSLSLRLTHPRKSITTILPRVLYSRSIIVKDGLKAKTYISKTAYITSDAQVRMSKYASNLTTKIGGKLTSYKAIFISLLIVGLAIPAGSVIGSDGTLLLAIFVALLYFAISLFTLLGTKGYSILEYINLILIIPIALLFTLALVVFSWLRSIVQILTSKG